MHITDRHKANLAVVAGALLGAAYVFNQQSAPPEPGISDDLLDRIAFLESSNNPDAVNRKTGFRGSYQMKPSRWLELLYLHGVEAGYPELAAPIHRTRRRQDDGTIVHAYVVRDLKARKQILDARHDGDLARTIARLGLEDNFAYLQGKMNGNIEKTDTVLYLTQHFGQYGAYKILTAVENTPRALFKEIVHPSVCAFNKDICYDRKTPRTVTEVRDFLSKKLENVPQSALTYNR